MFKCCHWTKPAFKCSSYFWSSETLPTSAWCQHPEAGLMFTLCVYICMCVCVYIHTHTHGAIFLKKIHSRMHSDPKFGLRGGGAVSMPGKNVLEHRSVLCHSENCWNGVLARSITDYPCIHTYAHTYIFLTFHGSVG
jgi:hypothetical protein